MAATTQVRLLVWTLLFASCLSAMSLTAKGNVGMLRCSSKCFPPATIHLARIELATFSVLG